MVKYTMILRKKQRTKLRYPQIQIGTMARLDPSCPRTACTYGEAQAAGWAGCNPASLQNARLPNSLSSEFAGEIILISCQGVRLCEPFGMPVDLIPNSGYDLRPAWNDDPENHIGQ